MRKKFDDDNNSAHFSANYSLSNKSDREREVHINSYRSNEARQNQLKLQAQLEAKNKEYDELEGKFKAVTQILEKTKTNLENAQK